MNEIDSAKLRLYLQRWTQDHPGWQPRPVHDIADELARDADFGSIKLAGWLQTPEGAAYLRITQSVLPYPYNYGADMLAEAVHIAARQRTESQRLFTLAGGSTLAVLLVLWLRNL